MTAGPPPPKAKKGSGRLISSGENVEGMVNEDVGKGTKDGKRRTVEQRAAKELITVRTSRRGGSNGEFW